MAWLHLLLYRLRALRFALTLRPMAGGDDPPPEPKPDDPPPEPKPDDPPPEPIKPDDDWKEKARKHEREAKRLRKEREELDRKLKERDDADKSDQEKALEAARKEAREEAETEGRKERRHDRLEAKCATLAAKGFKVGDGDDAKTVRFADPDDALVYIERLIRNGDLDDDEIFDSEGRVQADALTTALTDLLKSKPHLQADGKAERPTGRSDAGRGSGDEKDLEEMSIEEHEKAIRRHK
jgi:hypothetical protein